MKSILKVFLGIFVYSFLFSCEENVLREVYPNCSVPILAFLDIHDLNNDSYSYRRPDYQEELVMFHHIALNYQEYKERFGESSVSVFDIRNYWDSSPVLDCPEVKGLGGDMYCIIPGRLVYSEDGTNMMTGVAFYNSKKKTYGGTFLMFESAIFNGDLGWKLISDRTFRPFAI